MTTAEEVKVDHKSILAARLVWLGLSLVGFIWLVVTSKMLFFSPPPAEFLSAEIMTKQVEALGKPALAGGPGIVRMRAVIKAPLDPTCLTGTQYFLDFPDGSSIKMPGFRRTTLGDTKTAVYEVSVPRYAPPGQAVFWIRDNYNCGVQARRADSPHLTFTIVEPHHEPAN